MINVHVLRWPVKFEGARVQRMHGVDSPTP